MNDTERFIEMINESQEQKKRKLKKRNQKKIDADHEALLTRIRERLQKNENADELIQRIQEEVDAS